MKRHLALESRGLPVYYELSCRNTHDIVHGESLVLNCSTSSVKAMILKNSRVYS